MLNKAIIEALKEFGRLLIFSIPALLIQVITNNPVAATSWGGIILYLLRSVDKGIHEDDNIKANGLLPF